MVTAVIWKHAQQVANIKKQINVLSFDNVEWVHHKSYAHCYFFVACGGSGAGVTQLNFPMSVIFNEPTQAETLG